jgi:hypothetical protein
MLWLVRTLAAVAIAVRAGCGGSDKPATTTPAGEQVAVAAAAPDPGPPSPSNRPGEREDRASLCKRAVEHAIQIIQRDSTELQDPKDVETTRTTGVKDCVSSPATTDDIDCVIRAQSLDDLTMCGGKH